MIRVQHGDEERLYTLEEFEARARRGEVSPHAWVCMPALTGERFVKARELPLFVSLYDPRRIHFRRHFQIGRLPILTGLLAAACVGLYFISKDLGDGQVTRDALLLMGAKARARIVEDGEVWRLLMANLLHRDAVHLGFNLFALVNVGTVLEGVYRRGDLVLLLVVSGLSTMGLSVLMSGPVTVGASGLVFGCLGAAVVFGWRFSDVLPGRYRLYFGVVVVGYAAVMFYLGLRTPSTDNWGHAGGLLAGCVMGTLLEPRLLRLQKAREPLGRVALPWAVAGALAAGTWIVGPLAPELLFRTEPYRADAFGVILERPAHWTKVADPLGFLTFGNGVDAFTSLGCARVQGKSRVDEAVRRFVEGELWALKHSGNITRLEVGPATETAIGADPQVEARSVVFSLLASDGPLEAEGVLFSRGQLECALVLAHRPSAPEGSRKRLAEIRSGLRFEKTRAELEAEARAEEHPEDARAWLELGLARQTAGRQAAARRALARAEEQVRPATRAAAQVHFARARFELEHAGDLDAAREAADLAAAFGGADDLELALVRIDIAARSGATAEAASLLDEAEDRFGEDTPPLIARRQALAELERDL